MIGKIKCSQGGHKLTNDLLKKVFQDKENYSIVEINEKNIPHSLIYRQRLRSIAYKFPLKNNLILISAELFFKMHFDNINCCISIFL